jgi:hypothetical protein
MVNEVSSPKGPLPRSKNLLACNMGLLEWISAEMAVADYFNDPGIIFSKLPGCRCSMAI